MSFQKQLYIIMVAPVLTSVLIYGPNCLQAQAAPIPNMAEDVGSSTGENPHGSECKFYQWRSNSNSDESVAGERIFTGAGADLTCLDSLLEDAARCAEAAADERSGQYRPAWFNRASFSKRAWEENSAEVYSNTLTSDSNAAKYIATFEMMVDDCLQITVWKDRFGKGLSGDGMGFFNARCEMVTNVAPQELCGELRINEVSTPISLMWEQGADIDRQMAFVKFPLNPSARGKWYTWKASAAAPLLVYDPEHSGKIGSARQLFGNWTFGKYKTAGFQGSADSTSRPAVPWKDGFEALGTLDTDRDGTVSGAELKDLALWFDANQDAVSQPGEVRPLGELGVTKLYYTPDFTDPENGNIHVKRGFERIVSGIKFVGAAVDWMSEEARSQLELAAKAGSRARLSGEQPAQVAKVIKLIDTAPEAEILTAELEKAGVSGAWLWEITGDGQSAEFAPKGVLTFREGTYGEISGHSYVEMPARGSSPFKSLLTVSLIKGIQKLSPLGANRLQFESLGNDGSKTVTAAELSLDGKTLKGTSETVLPRKNRPGENTTFVYTWVAKRYQGIRELNQTRN